MLAPINVSWEQQYTSLTPLSFNSNPTDDYFTMPKSTMAGNELLTPHTPGQTLIVQRESLSPSATASDAGSRSSSYSAPGLPVQTSWPVNQGQYGQYETNASTSYGSQPKVGSQLPTPSPDVDDAALPDDDEFDPLLVQTLRPDGKPKRPMNAYMIFMRKYRPKLGAQYPEKVTGEISKMLSEMWKVMPDSEKEIWRAKHRKLIAKFNAENPTYQYARSANGTRRHGSRGGKGLKSSASNGNIGRVYYHPYGNGQPGQMMHGQTGPLTPPDFDRENLQSNYFNPRPMVQGQGHPSTSLLHSPQRYDSYSSNQSFASFVNASPEASMVPPGYYTHPGQVQGQRHVSQPMMYSPSGQDQHHHHHQQIMSNRHYEQISSQQQQPQMNLGYMTQQRFAPPSSSGHYSSLGLGTGPAGLISPPNQERRPSYFEARV